MVKINEIIVYVSPDIDVSPGLVGSTAYCVDVVRKITNSDGTHKVFARRSGFPTIDAAVQFQKASVAAKVTEVVDLVEPQV